MQKETTMCGSTSVFHRCTILGSSFHSLIAEQRTLPAEKHNIHLGAKPRCCSRSQSVTCWPVRCEFTSHRSSAQTRLARFECTHRSNKTAVVFCLRTQNHWSHAPHLPRKESAELKQLTLGLRLHSLHDAASGKPWNVITNMTFDCLTSFDA